MSGIERAGGRILGSLGSADGKGVVRMEDRFDTDIGDVWSALTDPSRLARWYGEVEGDLRPGGEFRVRVFASGWAGAGRVEACEPPRRLVVTGKEPDQPGGDVSEVTLAVDGDQTILVLDQPGLPLDQLAAYGAATQIHVEDLAAHLAGRERCDADARMDDFFPPIRTWRPTSVSTGCCRTRLPGPFAHQLADMCRGSIVGSHPARRDAETRRHYSSVCAARPAAQPGEGRAANLGETGLRASSRGSPEGPGPARPAQASRDRIHGFVRPCSTPTSERPAAPRWPLARRPPPLVPRACRRG